MNIAVYDKDQIDAERAEFKETVQFLVILKQEYYAVKLQAEADRLLTIKEACEYLRCNEDTLLYYRNKARLPYYKKGQLVLFRKGDIDECLAGGYVNRHKRTPIPSQKKLPAHA